MKSHIFWIIGTEHNLGPHSKKLQLTWICMINISGNSRILVAKNTNNTQDFQTHQQEQQNETKLIKI